MSVLSSIMTLAGINLGIQIILMAVVAWASYRAIKRKMNLKKHCTLFRWAVLVQFVTILAFMLLPMLGYVRTGEARSFSPPKSGFTTHSGLWSWQYGFTSTLSS